MKIRFIAAAGYMLLAGSVLSQTFTVSGKTGTSQLGLDDTVLVRYSVQLAGASATLQNVVPTLRTPGCANVTVGGEQVSLFSTTYAGYWSGSSFVLGPVPSWTNGQTKEVGFYIHLYDHAIGQGSICDDLCPGDITFDLTFTWAQHTQDISAASTPFLSMQRPDDNVTTIVERASNFASPGIGFVGTTLEFNWPLSVTSPFQTDLSNPDAKVFLAFDWDTFGTDPNFLWNFFIFPVAFNCAINHIHWSDHDFDLYAGTLLDTSGQVGGVDNGIIPLAPEGGAGGNPGQPGDGWNFYDITDLQVPCGRVKNVLNYSSGSFVSTLSLFQDPVMFRDGGIFIGIEGSCQSVSFAFGPPSEQFRFTELHSDSRGKVTARVAVPALWRSGSDLSSDYAIDWFIRKNDTFVAVTDINNDGVSLTLEADTGLSSTAGYVVEAQLRHLTSGDKISVRSPAHGYSYTMGAPVYASAEPTPDIYLDPGETATFPYTVTNASGENTTSVSVATGVEVDGTTQAYTASGPFPSSLAIGQQAVANLGYELLLGQACSEATFFVEVQHSRDVLTTSHRQYFDVAINCDDTFITEFRSLSNWTPQPSSKAAGGGGWSYNNGWSVEATDPSQLYTLQSPIVSTGQFPKFDLTHLPSLSLNLAGGVLEYQTSTDGVIWSGWSELILEIESYNSISLYHPLTFPSTVPSYIAGRRVWMFSNIPSSPIVFSDQAIDPGLINPLVDRFIRYRFAMMAPYLGQPESGLNPTWEVTDFTYTSQQPFIDNVFGVNHNHNFFSCAAWEIPIAVVGTYSASWYDSLQDLIDDVPHYTNSVTGNTAVWDLSQPTTVGTETYYLKLTDVSTQTTRVISFTVTVPQGGVPLLSTMLPDWEVDPAVLGSDLVVDGEVNIKDFVYRENEDVCN